MACANPHPDPVLPLVPKATPLGLSRLDSNHGCPYTHHCLGHQPGPHCPVTSERNSAQPLPPSRCSHRHTPSPALQEVLTLQFGVAHTLMSTRSHSSAPSAPGISSHCRTWSKLSLQAGSPKAVVRATTKQTSKLDPLESRPCSPRHAPRSLPGCPLLSSPLF